MYLLREIFEAHGGYDHWHSVDKIILKLRFHGLAFASKLNRSGLLERDVEVYAKRCKVIFHDYPVKGYTGYFENDVAWIEDRDGTRIKHFTNYRNSFSALQKTFFWNSTDLLYFAGYALWNYINLPFLLGNEGVSILSESSWNEGKETLYKLTAKFDNFIPTHCQEQSFYFDKDLLLVRHDYCPEIFSPYAKAAHYIWDYRDIDGLKIPFKRKVLPRMKDGTTKPWPKMVWIDITKAGIEYTQNKNKHVNHYDGRLQTDYHQA